MKHCKKDDDIKQACLLYEMEQSTQGIIYSISNVKPIYAALNIINEDVSNHIKLKQLARQSGTNECTLKKGFRTIFKISVYQYLLKSRMLKASILLQNQNIKQKDIAGQCGYESQAGFVTAFRKYYGLTPGEHRKKCVAAAFN